MRNLDRRTFICNTALGMAALPFGAGIFSKSAFAETLPRLDPSSQLAQALNYVEDASLSKHRPDYQSDATCQNCDSRTENKETCWVFPNNSISLDGWCTGYEKPEESSGSFF